MLNIDDRQACEIIDRMLIDRWPLENICRHCNIRMLHLVQWLQSPEINRVLERFDQIERRAAAAHQRSLGVVAANRLLNAMDSNEVRPAVAAASAVLRFATGGNRSPKEPRVPRQTPASPTPPMFRTPISPAASPAVASRPPLEPTKNAGEGPGVNRQTTSNLTSTSPPAR